MTTATNESVAELMTRDEAADYLNVSPRWVKRALDERHIPFIKVGAPFALGARARRVPGRAHD